MQQTKSLTEKSKFLSYLLRHNPEAAGLTLDKNGWCSLQQLIDNTDLTFKEICNIVYSDNKGRYSLDDLVPMRATAIRANQGHSTKQVDLSFKKAVPPCVLYHGTTASAYEKIADEGLKPMGRHYVHLSSDVETAKNVGSRRQDELVVLKVRADLMTLDGIDFFRSDNGVWLVSAVDAKYLSQEL